MRAKQKVSCLEHTEFQHLQLPTPDMKNNEFFSGYKTK